MKSINKIKKIVLIGPAWPLRGGISLFNVRLKQALNDIGIDTHIISFSRQYPGLLFPGQSQKTPEFRPSMGKPIIDTCNPMSWIKTFKYVKNLNPDIIIISWWHLWFWGSYKYLLDFFSKANFSVYFLCHNYHPHDQSNIWRRFTKSLFKKANGLLFLSEFTLNQRLETYPPKISLFHPFYEWKEWPIRPLSRWSKKILLAGCVKSYKGLEMGIGLLKKDPDLKLTIAGDFYENKLLKKTMSWKEKFQDRLMVLPGYCSDENMVKLMDEHDLLLCSYKEATQSGIAAFAFGRQRPVVATPVGGLPEQINHKIGVIAKTRSIDSLWEAVSTIYKHSPQDWAKGIKEVGRKKTWKYFAQNLCESLDQQKRFAFSSEDELTKLPVLIMQDEKQSMYFKPVISDEMISVIIRTHNRPGSLAQAIESVLNQTWRNIEILVVNDGSTKLKLNLPLSKNMPIQVLSTNGAFNRSYAANLGLKHAKGTMIVFLDDDDLFSSLHIESLLTAMNRNPWCSIAYSGVIVQNNNGCESFLPCPKFEISRLLKENFLPVHSALIRKDAIDAVGGFDESLDIFEDWDLWLRLALSNYSFVPVKLWTAIYRKHNHGTLKKIPFGSEKDISARWQVLKKHEHVIRNRLNDQGKAGKLRLMLRKLLFKIAKDLLS